MKSRQLMLFNRELSWLEFNQRVLDEALSEDTPLLERVKFLGIAASNLDEFFMVRVGGLEMLAASGSRRADPSGLTPARQLEVIGRRVARMVADQYACHRDLLEPQLVAAGIRRVRRREMAPDQARRAEEFFNAELLPVLSPLAVADPADMPDLPGLRLHVLVRQAGAAGRPERCAVIPVGAAMSRLVRLPCPSGHAYALVEDVIAMFAERLLPGAEIEEAVPFRITRNADIGVREDLGGDFMAEMEHVLDQRKYSDCVRLELRASASRAALKWLTGALRVRERGVYAVPGPVNLAGLSALAALEGYDELRYPEWTPQPSPQIDPRESIFDEIRRRDLVLCHPYESFDPVTRLVEEAARDPEVLAIKQILYRTSVSSPVVAALGEAASRGKYVTAVVELRARFDEARNIEWARELERQGAQVIYGLKGLKTHAKLCIVVRREAGGVVRYLHFGTGNYNERTARLYSDVGYMTCDPDLGADASAFFNSVTGCSEPQPFLKLAAAPLGLKERILELIENETARRRQGRRAAIRIKVNALVHPQVIEALYRASQAGVRVDLNVRGICCLRPGVKGLSENITVVSIVDRFLEHSRIFYFYQGGGERVFISSADLMPRNLDRRVELLVPVDDAACRRRLCRILDGYFRDNVKSRVLAPDGTYRAPGPARRRPYRVQFAMCAEALQAVRTAQAARRSVLQPHLPAEEH